MHPNLPREPDARRIARGMETWLRYLVAFFAVATIVCFVWFDQLTYLAAIPVPILTVWLVLMGYVRRRTRAADLRDPGQVQVGPLEERMDTEMAGVATTLKIAGILAVAALVLAASLFDWEVVGLMAAAIFVYLLFVGYPVWVAAVQTSAENERERITRPSSGLR